MTVNGATTPTLIPTPASVRTIAMDDVPANRRRGGDVRAVLSPATCGCKSGFMGTATLLPGESITEHWHPYSEEFLFCVEGPITVRLDGEDRTLPPRSGLVIPIGMRHRLSNDGDSPAFLVFQLGPLAPRPDLGHVDTEELPAGPQRHFTHAQIVSGAAT
jgi:putative monooxygenase